MRICKHALIHIISSIQPSHSDPNFKN